MTTMSTPHPHITHDVFNQAPVRVDVNEYTSHVALVEGVTAFGGASANDALRDVGALVGSAGFQTDARRTQRHEPVLHTHDRWGRRLDEVEYDPAYHRVIRDAVAAGAHLSTWADDRPGAAVARAATFLMFAQVEPGHACPISMSHAAVAAIVDVPDIAAQWLPRLSSREYEPALSADKPSALFGMAMTEKQGGSDVRAGTTRAIAAGDGVYRLTGHKWFCSAPMSDAFLALARVGDQPPSCFLVPRVLPGGERNVLRIQRLKDKLGNRSNASSEVEFDDTLGMLIGAEGRGVRAIIEMVQRTRLDCVLGTAAGMRQASAEALWHARGRSAFGRLLVDQPAMSGVLADLVLESEAAVLAGLRLAQCIEADASGHDVALRRIATPVLKYGICKRGPQHAYEALECLGGNGYTEDFPLAMRYREQPVMAVWEGSGNVIALDVLRALARDADAGEAVLAELDAVKGASPALDAHVRDVRELIAEVSRADRDEAERQARRLVETMSTALQASLMVRYAPGVDADAYIGARIGDGRAGMYGVLPRGTDAAAILARA